MSSIFSKIIPREGPPTLSTLFVLVELDAVVEEDDDDDEDDKLDSGRY